MHSITHTLDIHVTCIIQVFDISGNMSFSYQNGEARNLGDVKPRLTEETNDKSKIWKLTEINEPSQCRSLKLPENLRVTKVCSPPEHLLTHCFLSSICTSSPKTSTLSGLLFITA